MRAIGTVVSFLISFTCSNIIFNVQKTFLTNVIENKGPEGTAYYYVEPTFGNNPNRIRFFISGDDSYERDDGTIIDNLYNYVYQTK